MKKTLIIYYSFTGNTKEIVDLLADDLKIEVVQIEPLIAYDKDYDTVVSQGHTEVNQKICPQLKSIKQNIEEYDTIILASPIWWYTFAPVIRTFLTNQNLNNKKIIPIFTNGGYGIGHSMNDLKELCPKTILQNPLDISYENNQRQTSNNIIIDWVKKQIE